MNHELHIFDFDSTLFRSPEKPDDWKSGWWGNEVSLTPPMVPDKITPKDFFEPMLRRLRDAETAGYEPVVVTGRPMKIYQVVEDILAAVNLDDLIYDRRLYCTDKPPTLRFKLRKFEELVRERYARFEYPISVFIYDDREEHTQDFASLMRDLQAEGLVYDFMVELINIESNSSRVVAQG